MTLKSARALVVSLVLAAIATSAAGQWYQGPSGGSGGQSFDGWVTNGHSTNIRRVVILAAKSNKGIQCIEALYPSSPTDPMSGYVGSAGPDGCNVNNKEDSQAQFDLDPNEYILGISGTYSDHVNSLRFYTNKRNSPVYGEGAAGAIFGYTAPLGQMIVAFTQANDSKLRSIGVMYAACDSRIKACK